MSKWVVDTCVIIDVLSGDGMFSAKSADAIDMKRAEGLAVAPITYVELAPSFLGDVAKQDMVLSAKRPIADVLIGAYAMEKGGLITRNEADFKTLYPDLTIFNPVSPAS